MVGTKESRPRASGRALGIPDGADFDLRSAAAEAPVLLWRAAHGQGCTWVGPQWTAYTGLSAAQSLGVGWLEALHPEDRDATLRAFAAAPSASAEVDHRIRASSGDYRWHRTRAALYQEWAGASVDIDDLQRARAALESELGEARRRMRSTLGIVRSVARRTAETSENAESYAMHFEGRLDALARVESHLARGGGAVALETLAADEITAFLAREDSRLTISGPQVLVRAEAAETLALLFHELAANAIKYGALSPLGGRLKISWRLDSRTLRICWRESRVPLKAPLRRGGFGAELVTRGLAVSLRAEAAFEVKADGLSCTVAIPLDAVVP